MTIIQKIKHKLAVRDAAKRRKLERDAAAWTASMDAAQSQKHHTTSLRMARIRFGEMAAHFGLN
jgi:hypothetical protein